MCVCVWCARLPNYGVPKLSSSSSSSFQEHGPRSSGPINKLRKRRFFPLPPTFGNANTCAGIVRNGHRRYEPNEIENRRYCGDIFHSFPDPLGLSFGRNARGPVDLADAELIYAKTSVFFYFLQNPPQKSCARRVKTDSIPGPNATNEICRDIFEKRPATRFSFPGRYDGEIRFPIFFSTIYAVPPPTFHPIHICQSTITGLRQQYECGVRRMLCEKRTVGLRTYVIYYFLCELLFNETPLTLV